MKDYNYIWNVQIKVLNQNLILLRMFKIKNINFNKNVNNLKKK